MECNPHAVGMPKNPTLVIFRSRLYLPRREISIPKIAVGVNLHYLQGGMYITRNKYISIPSKFSSRIKTLEMFGQKIRDILAAGFVNWLLLNLLPTSLLSVGLENKPMYY
jgi:hypothetical protein